MSKHRSMDARRQALPQLIGEETDPATQPADGLARNARFRRWRTFGRLAPMLARLAHRNNGERGPRGGAIHLETLPDKAVGRRSLVKTCGTSRPTWPQVARGIEAVGRCPTWTRANSCSGRYGRHDEHAVRLRKFRSQTHDVAPCWRAVEPLATRSLVSRIATRANVGERRRTGPPGQSPSLRGPGNYRRRWHSLLSCT